MLLEIRGVTVFRGNDEQMTLDYKFSDAWYITLAFKLEILEFNFC